MAPARPEESSASAQVIPAAWLERESRAHVMPKSVPSGDKPPCECSPHVTAGICSPPADCLRDQGVCVVHMSPQSVPSREAKPKSGSDKGICAGCVGHTTTENVSTTQRKGHVSHVVDTPNRTTDNGGSRAARDQRS
jgi:hypothetical protein